MGELKVRADSFWEGAIFVFARIGGRDARTAAEGKRPIGGSLHLCNGSDVNTAEYEVLSPFGAKVVSALVVDFLVYL